MVRHLALALALSCVSLGACTTDAPGVTVPTLAKTVHDALVLGKEAGAARLEVEASVAYGLSAGVDIPITVPIELGGSSDATTKVKLVFENLQATEVKPFAPAEFTRALREETGASREGVFQYDRASRKLTPVRGE